MSHTREKNTSPRTSGSSSTVTLGKTGDCLPEKANASSAKPKAKSKSHSNFSKRNTSVAPHSKAPHRTKSASSLSSLSSCRSSGFTRQNDDDEASSSLSGKAPLSTVSSCSSKILKANVSSLIFNPYQSPVYSDADDTSSLKGFYDGRLSCQLVASALPRSLAGVPEDEATPVGVLTMVNTKRATLVIQKVRFDKVKQCLVVDSTHQMLAAVGLHPAIGRPPSSQTIAEMATYTSQCLLLRLALFSDTFADELKCLRYPFSIVTDAQPLHLDGSSITPNDNPNTGAKYAPTGQPSALPVPVFKARVLKSKGTSASRGVKSSELKSIKIPPIYKSLKSKDANSFNTSEGKSTKSNGQQSVKSSKSNKAQRTKVVSNGKNETIVHYHRNMAGKPKGK